MTGKKSPIEHTDNNAGTGSVQRSKAILPASEQSFSQAALVGGVAVSGDIASSENAVLGRATGLGQTVAAGEADASTQINTSVGLNVPEELAAERKTIDNIDAALICILAERFRCTQRVGHIKAKFDLPPADPQREELQVKRLRALAESAGLDPDFAEKFLGFMVREVIRHHEAIKREYTDN